MEEKSTWTRLQLPFGDSMTTILIVIGPVLSTTMGRVDRYCSRRPRFVKEGIAIERVAHTDYSDLYSSMVLYTWELCQHVYKLGIEQLQTNLLPPASFKCEIQNNQGMICFGYCLPSILFTPLTHYGRFGSMALLSSVRFPAAVCSWIQRAPGVQGTYHFPFFVDLDLNRSSFILRTTFPPSGCYSARVDPRSSTLFSSLMVGLDLVSHVCSALLYECDRS